SAPIRRRAARLSLLGLLTDQIQAWVSSTITLLDFPFIEYGIDYVAVKFYAAQEFSRCVRIRWNDLSDRFTAFRYDKRLASPGDVVDKGEAVSLELTRGYCFGLTAHGQII